MKTFQIIAESLFISRFTCCAYVRVEKKTISLFDFDLMWSQIEQNVKITRVTWKPNMHPEHPFNTHKNFTHDFIDYI